MTYSKPIYKTAQAWVVTRRSTHRAIVWDLGRMAEQLHAILLVVPQHGGVVQEALLCDSLSIPTKLDITKAVVCNSNADNTDANQKQLEC